MLFAAASGNIQKVRSLIAANPEAARCTDGATGMTPLICSAKRGHAATTSFLISHSNIDAVDNNGNTALHWAVAGGRLECVKTLLLRGADRHIMNDLGKRPGDLVTPSSNNQIFKAIHHDAHILEEEQRRQEEERQNELRFMTEKKRAELEHAAALKQIDTATIGFFFECTVCMSTSSDRVVLLPCKHASFCGTCAPKLDKCPICRRIVATRMNVFC